MAKPKELTGTVISDKMNKTIVVRTMHRAKHPVYGRIVKRYNKFKVHDEKGSAHVGDIVTIIRTRPLSKEKTFRLVSVVRKSQLAGVELKEEAV
ncbi:MAG: 30S ribosomal protein S17 [Candidatus Omnitrophica bacterium]|nr:30S ribosomal protein S17 [Candidatus Omnitrophota bacterium]